MIGRKRPKNKVIGVIWGRFNPPHKGHMNMIRRLAAKVGTLIVVIGSSEFKNDKKNPFSGLERRGMMIAYLKESGIRNVRVVVQKDGKSYFWAYNTLVKNCKPDILFFPDTNEKPELLELVRTKFKGRLGVVTFRRTGTISATRLRDAIALDKKWRHMTGKSVVKLIKTFDGIKRIKRAYRVRNLT